MKIAHTADLHISEQSHISILRMIVDKAASRKCEHLLIAGDLFDSDEHAKIFSRAVTSELARFPGAAWIIPGNHDPITAQVCYVERGKIFSNAEHVLLPDGSVIIGIPYIKNKGLFDLIVERTVEKQGKRTILLAHGTVCSNSTRMQGDSHFPVMIEDLKKLGCTYAALGHFHLPFKDSSGSLVLVNPGSPRVTRASDFGMRKFVVFDTSIGSVEDVFLEIPFNEQVVVGIDFLMKETEVIERSLLEIRKAVSSLGQGSRLANFEVSLSGSTALSEAELDRVSMRIGEELDKAGLGSRIDLIGIRVIGEEVLSDPSVQEILASIDASEFADKKELESFAIRLLSEIYAGKL
jgi:DNA repair exonuclease SbcCD nuclease subunit